MRILPEHDAGRHVRVRVITHDADSKALNPEAVGGGRAFSADEVRHDVSRGALAPIDQERDGGAASGRRWLLRNDGAARISSRTNFGDAQQFQAIVLDPQLGAPLGLSDQGGNSARAGAGADPDLDGALAPGGHTGWRVLGDHIARRDCQMKVLP